MTTTRIYLTTAAGALAGLLAAGAVFAAGHHTNSTPTPRTSASATTAPAHPEKPTSPAQGVDTTAIDDDVASRPNVLEAHTEVTPDGTIDTYVRSDLPAAGTSTTRSHQVAQDVLDTVLPYAGTHSVRVHVFAKHTLAEIRDGQEIAGAGVAQAN